MSDSITVTGNEAQFNENVTFLKDVNIQGKIFYDDLEGADDNFKVDNLIVNNKGEFDAADIGNLFVTGFTTVNYLRVTGVATFQDEVIFNQSLSYNDLEIRDRLRVGFAGTIIYAADDEVGNPIVGIGTSYPGSTLDVAGLTSTKQLFVSGLSTFAGDVFVGAGVTIGFAPVVPAGGIHTYMYFPDDGYLAFGNDEDLKIFSYNGNAYVETFGDANLNFRTRDNTHISMRAALGEYGEPDDEVMANFFPNAGVELMWDNIVKLETTEKGFTGLGIGYIHHDSTGNNRATLGIGVSDFDETYQSFKAGIASESISMFSGIGTDVARVGIGTTNPIDVAQLNESAQGPLRLNINGSVAIGRNIYDSVGSPGQNNYWLKRDQEGIRWVALEPTFQEGIWIEDEGVKIPITGTAQTFTTINFAKDNSFGLGVNGLLPTAADDNNITGLATVFELDYWGHTGATGLSTEGQAIYRFSNVGIHTGGIGNNYITNPFEVGYGHSVFVVSSNNYMVGIGTYTPTNALEIDTSLKDGTGDAEGGLFIKNRRNVNESILKTRKAIEIEGHSGVTTHSAATISYDGQAYFKEFVGIGVSYDTNNPENTDEHLYIKKPGATARIEDSISLNYIGIGASDQKGFNYVRSSRSSGGGIIPLVLMAGDGDNRKWAHFKEDVTLFYSNDQVNSDNSVGISIRGDQYHDNDNKPHVGIGHTEPIRTLHVKDGASSMFFTEYDDGAALLLDGADGDLTGDDYFGLHAYTAGLFALSYKQTDQLISVKSSGETGIGTTNPSEKLEVKGNYIKLFNEENFDTGLIIDSGYSSSQKSSIIFKDRTTHEWTLGKTEDSVSTFRLTDVANTNNPITVKSGVTTSPVGIHTDDPQHALDIKGSVVRIQNPDGPITLRLSRRLDSTDGLITFYTGNANDWSVGQISGGKEFHIKNNISAFVGVEDAVTINQESDVGIGSTSPSDRLDVFGTAKTVNLNVTGIATFTGSWVDVNTTAGITTVGFGASTYYGDNVPALFGDEDDLKIYHSGTETFIHDAGTGNLYIDSNDLHIRNAEQNATAAIFDADDSVTLNFNNEERFKTIGAGVTVTGTTYSNELSVSGVSSFHDNVYFRTGVGNTGIKFNKTDNSFDWDDDVHARFGDNNELLIYHETDGSSYITESGTGDLVLRANNLNLGSIDGAKYFYGYANDRVELYYNGEERLRTTGYGVSATGLHVTGVSTFKEKAWFEDDVDVDGLTELDELNVAGIASFAQPVGFAATIALDSHIKDVNEDIGTGQNDVGTYRTDYRLSSVGTGVSWRPSGVQTKRTIWVTKNGDDRNSGLLEGDAKATVGAAASVAQQTDTIKIRPGVYYENNPIGLRTDVSITGEDLRLVTIIPNNPTKDVIHVRNGCLVENLNFVGLTTYTSHQGAGAVAFPPPDGPETANSGYIEPGPFIVPPGKRYKSPYVRNCTNFMCQSIGMKIDGDHATAQTFGQDLKSMVCDSFTQYNEAGVGVSITNDGYAQLVSIFTINCDIAIYCDTGGQCDLTNSNSSFGNFGLVAVGLGSTQFTGIVSNTNTAGDFINSTVADNQDTVVCADVFDSIGNPRRPFDGQALYFQINLDNYPDVDGSGRITSPLQQVQSIKILDGADVSGFSAIDPPSIVIRDADGTLPPKGPQGVIAEASASVSPTGNITSIEVVATGRNYLPSQKLVVDVEGNIGIATIVTQPIYYTVESATFPVTSGPLTGISTITFNEFVPYELFPDDPFSLKRISRILTSSHSFEYVGTGTDINTSTPLQGAIPIKENEIVASDGAQIPFTATDQQGNFDIGQGIQINQTTSTITGRDFSRAIQAEVTPLILALR